MNFKYLLKDYSPYKFKINNDIINRIDLESLVNLNFNNKFNNEMSGKIAKLFNIKSAHNSKDNNLVKYFLISLFIIYLFLDKDKILKLKSKMKNINPIKRIKIMFIILLILILIFK